MILINIKVKNILQFVKEKTKGRKNYVINYSAANKSGGGVEKKKKSKTRRKKKTIHTEAKNVYYTILQCRLSLL